MTKTMIELEEVEAPKEKVRIRVKSFDSIIDCDNWMEENASWFRYIDLKCFNENINGYSGDYLRTRYILIYSGKVK